MNKHEQAKHNYEVMRDEWNKLPGPMLTDPYELKTCYHEESDREPKRWKNIWLCNRCGFWIKELGKIETTKTPNAT